MAPTYSVTCGDCLDLLPSIPSGSIDAIIADPPYGTTACKWDTVIPLAPMWEQLKRVIKPRGAIVLFASQPFTSALVMSNADWFKYAWIWDKVRPAGFQVAKYRPMMRQEDICVFGKGSIRYFPEMTLRDKAIKGRVASRSESSPLKYNDGITREYTHRFPQSIIVCPKPNNPVHPTQKPVPLLQYLIRTYTTAGETILDFTIGSGSTGVAAMLEGRNVIGFDTDPHYCDIARQRISEAAKEAAGSSAIVQPAQPTLEGLAYAD